MIHGHVDTILLMAKANSCPTTEKNHSMVEIEASQINHQLSRFTPVRGKSRDTCDRNFHPYLNAGPSICSQLPTSSRY